MFKKRYRQKHFFPLLFTIIIGVSVMLLTIGFSAFQDSLRIDNLSADVRIDKDIRIMGVSINEVKEAVSNYEEYNVSNITSNISLLNEDSYIIYKVSIYNLGNVIMGIKDIAINNENLKVEPINYNLKNKICDDNNKCLLGAKKELEIKVSYKEGTYNASQTSFDIRCDFAFAPIYTISYKNVSGTSLPSEIIEGDTLTVNFTKRKSETIKIVMNNRFLNDTEYSYIDDTLTIPEVTGNLNISVQELSIMKRKIISQYYPSGLEEDVPLYDFGAMSYEERKNTFGDVASSSGIFRTNGFTGKTDAIVFRGNITNNYVKFAGYTWRILQIDEDGNLRIILDDKLSNNVQYNSNSTISSLDEAPNTLGFSNSLIKSTLENWYTNLTPWQDKIVQSNFCTDFTSTTKTSSGSGNKVYYFKSYQNIGRDVDIYTPSLTCTTNQSIKNNIGLISAEEYVLAGGAFEKPNQNIFLYNSSFTTYYWTLSPSFYDTSRNNGNVFIIKEDGRMSDYTNTLLTSRYSVRPVITISGNYDMQGDGTKSNAYHYEGTNTATATDITDLSTLSNGKWFIGSTVGVRKVYGIMSAEVSTTLDNVEGLLGKDTAYFTDNLNSITNIKGITLSFENGTPVEDGYLYQIKTPNGRYLKINDDKSVILTSEPTNCKVMLSTDSQYSCQINITNESGTTYLNFYGGESADGDDKFAGWEELDTNAYIRMYKVDFE